MAGQTKTSGRPRSASPRRPSKEAAENGHELDATEVAAEKHTVTNEAHRELQRANKQLHVRIRELELQLAGGPPEQGEAADSGDASDEGASIIALIRDLHSRIDAAQELKEALEADLATMRAKSAEDDAARSELEARVKLLEAKAALGDQLREDLSFVEEERNEIARRLEQATAQLGKITRERDGLAEQSVAGQARIRELQSDKIALEAKGLNLEEMVADMDRLRQEHADLREESSRLKENGESLKGKLDTAESAGRALELELTTTRDLVRNQNKQMEELKDNLVAARADAVDLRAKLDRALAENANLSESNKRADHELKTLNARIESVRKELELSKKALRDIRTAAMRTTSRAREQSSGT